MYPRKGNTVNNGELMQYFHVKTFSPDAKYLRLDYRFAKNSQKHNVEKIMPNLVDIAGALHTHAYYNATTHAIENVYKESFKVNAGKPYYTLCCRLRDRYYNNKSITNWLILDTAHSLNTLMEDLLYYLMAIEDNKFLLKKDDEVWGQTHWGWHLCSADGKDLTDTIEFRVFKNLAAGEKTKKATPGHMPKEMYGGKLRAYISVNGKKYYFYQDTEPMVCINPDYVMSGKCEIKVWPTFNRKWRAEVIVHLPADVERDHLLANSYEQVVARAYACMNTILDAARKRGVYLKNVERDVNKKRQLRLF